MALRPVYVKVFMEVYIDPHSAFWIYRDPVDPNGDPLELLIRSEEGDEAAVEIINRDGFSFGK